VQISNDTDPPPLSNKIITRDDGDVIAVEAIRMVAERATRGLSYRVALRILDYQRHRVYRAEIIEHRQLRNSNAYANSYSNNLPSNVSEF